MRNKLPGTVSAAYLLIFFGGVLISLFSESFSNLQLNPFDYARITDVDYKAVICPFTRGTLSGIWILSRRRSCSRKKTCRLPGTTM